MFGLSKTIQQWQHIAAISCNAATKPLILWVWSHTLAPGNELHAVSFLVLPTSNKIANAKDRGHLFSAEIQQNESELVVF